MPLRGCIVRACYILFLSSLLIASILPQFGSLPARAQGAADVKTLLRESAQLYGQGKYAEAVAASRRALFLAEKMLGPEHPDTLSSLNSLALSYLAQGLYGEAAPLYLRALKGREKTLGPQHPDTLISTNNLANLYRTQGRYKKAEPLFLKALRDYEKTLGPQHAEALLTANNLARLYQSQGRYGEAERLLLRVRQGYEKTLGPQHLKTLSSTTGLASVYQSQGRYSEAESLFQRALPAYEKALGPQHPDTLRNVNNLAALYFDQGRYDEAEALYQRALQGREKTLGPKHPGVLATVNNLAVLYQTQGRYGEAEPLFQRAVQGYEKALGPQHSSTLKGVTNLADLYKAQGRYGEAEPLYLRALQSREKTLGPQHPGTLLSVNNLAILYKAQGRYSEAEPLHLRVLQGNEKALGLEHPHTLLSINNLAVLYFAQSNWLGAAQLFRRSTAGIASRVQRGALDAALTGKKASDAQRSDWQFWGLVKAVYRLAPEGGAPDAALAGEMFHIAQWALTSEAGQSLAQMAARGAKGDAALASLVRERQDLANEWQDHERTQAAALGTDPEKRDAEAEAENLERMATVDRRIEAIDRRLRTGFPDYFARANPGPLSVKEVQAQLRADESLVLFLDTRESKPTPEETFIWVVTKTEMRWLRTELGKPALIREVHALRCGLDRAAWEGQSRCPEVTGQAKPGVLLPFDPTRANRLYTALLGKAEDLIKGKHLLIVPSGALTQLPFTVLVSAAPKPGGKIAWLARDHAITVLPAVSSLKALRAAGHPSAAREPFVGFGNPLLDGPDDGSYLKSAALARDKQRCPKSPWLPVAELVSLYEGVGQVETRNGVANVSDIRRLIPLPETADELCAVARDISGTLSDIHLGAHATERDVKAMSESGELAKYRIVHFATHGAMAGQLNSSSEPGLILTPPYTASREDDGYLSASEIAGLKLDADWVILSACNTAAGQSSNAEALSGLARAFIYAQARALLVSHWAVDSDATVKLITSAMRELARDNNVGRAEALRRAMLALIDGGDVREAHPSSWAAFIVVGEGAL